MSGLKFSSQIDMQVPATEANHVARLGDVVALLDGKTKAPVRAITVANLTVVYASGAKTLTASANGALTIDDVSIALNDRVLINGQTDKTQNGIYMVAAVGDASNPFVLTRDSDMDTSIEIYEGMRVFVSEGTLYAGTVWKLQGTGPFTLDTSNIEFLQDMVKYTEILEKVFDLVGDNTKIEFSFTHDFGTKNVDIIIYDATTGEDVYVVAQRTSVNDIKIIPGIVLTPADAYKVVVRAVVSPV